MKRHIFVVGLEDFNRRLLKQVRQGENYCFHPLLDYESVAKRADCDVDGLLASAFETLDSFPHKIDAIVGYWDFPTILMLPILRERYGLPGPRLGSVLQCEHKYWARLLEREVVPHQIPRFALVDPFASEAEERPPLEFPFWIKPVKAHSSKLGFRVSDRRDYRSAIEAIRAGIDRFAVNFNQIMSRAELPDEIAAADGWKCLAEGLISAGRQCTLEGYVFDGKPRVYGVVDSVRGPNRSSFERYEYPSTLPRAVRERMVESAERLIGKTGLDDSPFNIEYYWHRRSGDIWLLEINARISKSHSPLFEKVHGVPHNEVMIDVALGEDPNYPPEEGRYTHAAKFMLRRYDCADDQVVRRAPGGEQVRAIEADCPGSEINLHVSPGMRLGELHHHDSYSHELAEIFVGANSHQAMMRTYRQIVERLEIEIGEAV